MKILKKAVEFDWDKGNIGKNKKHNVSDKEAKEVFFDKKIFIFKDIIHSKNDPRFRILGKTRKERLLLSFSLLEVKKIEIILARDINRKEVYLYEKKLKLPKFKNEDKEREFW